MLDDLKIIHQRDAQDCLGRAEKQWQDLTRRFELPAVFDSGHIYNIVFIGMDSLATGADIARQWLDVMEPFEVVRNYTIPSYVDEDTLCIVASLDSDDAGLVAILDQIGACGARVIVITSEGKLADMVQIKQLARPKQYILCMTSTVSLANPPDTVRPVQPVCLMIIKALTDVCAAFRLLKDPSSKQQELAKQTEWLAGQLYAWRPDVPVVSNLAKRTALEFIGKSVVVYAGPLLSGAAHYWKISINHYAKQIAWSGEYLEHSFDDIAGWSKQPMHKPYAVVELRSDFESDYIQKSYVATERLLSGLRPAPTVVRPMGSTLLQQLLYVTVLGDFVAIYLALLNGVNPAASDLVNKFKKELV